MNELTLEQQRRNRESVNGWNFYASHREIITKLILESAPGGADTLTVLGAGNCNDLDLNRLVESFRMVSLVDLDRPSVENGVTRQGLLAAGSGIAVHETDLSGLFNELAALSHSATDTKLDELKSVAASAEPAALPDPANVVISTGLITQLVEATIRAVGESRFAEQDSASVRLVQAVRRRHLRLLSELTRPGGAAILVTEVVSSDTAPGICDNPVTELPTALSGCLAAGNFFTGLHPGIIHSELSSDEFGSGFESVQATPPWLWQFTARTYAVVAFVARRETH